MKLTKGMRKSLVGEIRFVAQNMKKVQSGEEKLYFFSAIFGAALRIMNLEYSSDLAFTHHVVSASYNTMNNSLTLVKSGQGVNTFPKNIFAQLENAVEKLADIIERDEPIYEVLETISNLAYSTTGNGFYLQLKGAYKI